MRDSMVSIYALSYSYIYIKASRTLAIWKFNAVLQRLLIDPNNVRLRQQYLNTIVFE